MTDLRRLDADSSGSPPRSELASIITPALTVDRAILSANIDAMAIKAARYGMALWPHAKTHKSKEIAQQQLAAGAAGITVSTIAEAEMMASAGVRDLLLAYPPVDPWRLGRIIGLAKMVRLRVSVDDVDTVVRLDRACDDADVEIGFLWEVDSGNHRCGSVPGRPTAELVSRAIAETTRARYDGLMTFAGHAYGAQSEDELKLIAGMELDAVRATAAALRERGIASRALSVGSTPTVRQFTNDARGLEIRPGNYVFNDATQVALGVASIDQCALSVLTTVISRPAVDRVILDAGSKALSSDRMTGRTGGFGLVRDVEGIEIERLYEEHAIARISPDCPLGIGSRVQVIPNHACASVNLHSTMLVTSDGEIEDAWPVAAREWS